VHELITTARESDSLICVSQSTDPLPTDIATLQALLAQARAERDAALAERDHLQSQIEAGLKAKGLQSRIHRRAARNRPLPARQKSANTTRSKVRARVEHVFGQQQNSMGGKIVRTIGIVRARFKIGMMNLGYNIRRLVQLERMAAAPA
jgi:IS5 family transposase